MKPWSLKAQKNLQEQAQEAQKNRKFNNYCKRLAASENRHLSFHK